MQLTLHQYRTIPGGLLQLIYALTLRLSIRLKDADSRFTRQLRYVALWLIEKYILAVLHGENMQRLPKISTGQQRISKF